MRARPRPSFDLRSSFPRRHVLFIRGAHGELREKDRRIAELQQQYADAQEVAATDPFAGIDGVSVVEKKRKGGDRCLSAQSIESSWMSQPQTSVVAATSDQNWVTRPLAQPQSRMLASLVGSVPLSTKARRIASLVCRPRRRYCSTSSGE